VGEPNAAHRKLLRQADELAYRKVKEFDFPHKRAALMHCGRAQFFSRVRL
jgi:acetyl CoA:N6-hydroxylysine acetyl transferase